MPPNHPCKAYRLQCALKDQRRDDQGLPLTMSDVDGHDLAGLLKYVVSVAIFAVVAISAYYLIVGQFSFSAFAREYGELNARIAEHPWRAGAVGIGIYTSLVVLLLPGAPFFAIAFGLVYGWLSASIVVLMGTGIGVAALYGAVIWLLPEHISGRAGTALEKMAKGLERNTMIYLLFLRMMPPVPFTLLNVAAPALKVPFWMQQGTTLVGMAPRIAVYAFAGESLRAVIDQRIAVCQGIPDCSLDLSVDEFLTDDIVLALVLLAIVSLAPLIIRRWMRAG